MCEGSHYAIHGSGHFGTELTENIRQFDESKFYGTLKHLDYQGGITNSYMTYLTEKSVLNFQDFLTICKEKNLYCQKNKNSG